LSYLLDELVTNEQNNNINKLIQDAEVGYISTAGTVSKNGFNAYKRFISSLDRQRHVKKEIKGTVWDSLKRIDKK